MKVECEVQNIEKSIHSDKPYLWVVCLFKLSLSPSITKHPPSLLTGQVRFKSKEIKVIYQVATVKEQVYDLERLYRNGVTESTL
jgi:hypothetical protein